MGHLSQIEAVMEAYDDILYHYPDDGEDPLNMPKKEVIVKKKKRRISTTGQYIRACACQKLTLNTSSNGKR
ncbi:hypothetical protein QL093DRAFT_2309875 [Fusarium oxysporum]|nr:hypothetical protein QL093DRAFT_2309875 [Fusarium oxysporum]